MTQGQKDLLLKDLSSRLPYGVRCSFGVDDTVYEVCGINPTCCGASEIQATHIKSSINGDFQLSSCKPYLFPLSSMTDEQIYKSPFGYATMDTIRQDDVWSAITIGGKKYYHIFDWLNKNHFDYRGLIPMGLARDATGLNIY